ncbi:MAG TPA: ABC transporter permease [Candidatus Bathyarchaeia archaeon]|nr:ABC transporter permease [Candidatus Bathyarchaeia archaeon]
MIIERDVRVLFSDAYLVAIMFANFAIDLFVTAATFGRLVTGQGANYFLYIAPGSNLITSMVAAFQSGRDVWREKYIKDLTSYLLTLPVQRPILAFSRVLGGVVRSVIATFPGTLVICYLYGIIFSPKILIAYLIVGIFSLGIVGLSMAISAFSSSIEMWVTVRSAIQLYLSFLSTLFYPVTVFPSFLWLIVSSNPMTWAIQAFRQLSPTGFPQVPTGDPLGSILVLAGPSLIFALLGTVCYIWYSKQ